MSDKDKWFDELMAEFEEEERQAKQKDDLAFLAWAEHTHPVSMNNLREAYQRYKEMKK